MFEAVRTFVPRRQSSTKLPARDESRWSQTSIREWDSVSVYVCVCLNVYVSAWSARCLLGKFIVKCRKINIKHFATNVDTFKKLNRWHSLVEVVFLGHTHTLTHRAIYLESCLCPAFRHRLRPQRFVCLASCEHSVDVPLCLSIQLPACFRVCARVSASGFVCVCERWCFHLFFSMFAHINDIISQMLLPDSLPAFASCIFYTTYAFSCRRVATKGKRKFVKRDYMPHFVRMYVWVFVCALYVFFISFYVLKFEMRIGQTEQRDAPSTAQCELYLLLQKML